MTLLFERHKTWVKSKKTAMEKKTMERISLLEPRSLFFFFYKGKTRF